MARIDFLDSIQSRTSRNYLERVVEHDKAACAERAKKWGFDYWDGDRAYGYGGYRYDGRWRTVAEEMVGCYGIAPGDRILDVGCGKAHLLYEFTQAVAGVEVAGLDISEYGVAHAHESVRNRIVVGNCTALPWPDNSFDLVISLNVFHNLYNYELKPAIREVERVGRRHKYVCNESYRSEREKTNLLYWQLTCETFFTPDEWAWAFHEYGYSGDFGFIFFE